MPISPEHEPGQLPLWNRWHSRHVAVDDSALHLTCRQDLLSGLPSPPCSGPILELGTGQGFDAMAISEAGYEVEALDFSNVALKIARDRLAGHDGLQINYLQFDISQPLPYLSATFSGIFSYLALHYFDSNTTRNIFEEIARVASQSCVFSFGVRSTEDPLFGRGERLDRNYYILNGHIRHFFDVDEVAGLLSKAWTVQDLRVCRAFYLSTAQPEGSIVKGLAVRN
jgi:Methyltransferase domain